MTAVTITHPPDMRGEKLRRFLHQTFGSYKETENETISINKSGELEMGRFDEISLMLDPACFVLNRNKLIKHCLNTKQEEDLGFMELSVNGNLLPM